MFIKRYYIALPIPYGTIILPFLGPHAEGGGPQALAAGGAGGPQALAPRAGAAAGQA